MVYFEHPQIITRKIELNLNTKLTNITFNIHFENSQRYIGYLNLIQNSFKTSVPKAQNTEKRHHGIDNLNLYNHLFNILHNLFHIHCFT